MTGTSGLTAERIVALGSSAVVAAAVGTEVHAPVLGEPVTMRAHRPVRSAAP